MKSNQKKYLDKVVDILDKETIFDYHNEEMRYPFPLSDSTYDGISIFPAIAFSSSFRPTFSQYCRDTYGLTNPEIDYVWKEYGNIIKDEIEN